MSGVPAYDAFISYRRSDGAATARWLRRELEAFRPPKSLREKYFRRLKVYQDTAYERGTSDFYEHSIRPALLQSRFLLVLATPDAVRRTKGEDWVAREIGDFTRGPFRRNVIAVRAAGEFDGPLPGNLAELFPNIEIVDVRGASRFSYLNPLKAARLSAEKLKLVAPLLDLAAADMPRLRQEEERREQGRLGTTTGAAFGVLAAVTGLSVYALQSRNEAIRAMEDSMYAAGGMAMEASRLQTSGKASERSRHLLISRGCDLVDKFRSGATREPQAEEYVMCRLERAREHEALSELQPARAQIEDAIAFSKLQHDRLARMDAALGQVKAQQALAEYLLRIKDGAGAEKAFGALREASRALAKRHDGRADLIASEATALDNLAFIAANREDRAAAASGYGEAADAVARLIKARAESAAKAPPSPDTIMWLSSLHRAAAEQMFALADRDQAAIRLQQAIRAVRDNLEPAKVPADLELAAAVAGGMLARLENGRGQYAEAQAARAEAMASAQRVRAAAGVSEETKQKAAGLVEALQADARADARPAVEAKSP